MTRRKRYASRDRRRLVNVVRSSYDWRIVIVVCSKLAMWIRRHRAGLTRSNCSVLDDSARETDIIRRGY